MKFSCPKCKNSYDTPNEWGIKTAMEEKHVKNCKGKTLKKLKIKYKKEK